MNKYSKALFVILFIFTFSNLVYADGMMYIEPYDSDMEILPWMPQPENAQFVAINYEDGIQNMIIGIDTGEIKGNKAVWIFPVPVNANDIEIDIMKGFPQLNGRLTNTVKNDTVNAAFALNGISQIYTLPFYFFATLLTNIGSMAEMQSADSLEMRKNITGLEIHEHIEAMGLATEVVSGNDIGIIYSYLKINGFEVPVTSKALLDEYTGQGYTFVVTWINDVEEYNEQAGKSEEDPYDDYYGRVNYNNQSKLLGVQVSFPYKEIYFPLKPTSIYNEKEIPVAIYVMNHVTPTVFPEIEENTVTTYFVQNNYSPTQPLIGFFNDQSKIDKLKYTKIKIDTQAKNFTADLWIANYSPPDIALADAIIENSLLFMIMLFALISCCSSLIAGTFVFRKDKPDLVKFFLFGLTNFLTLIGFFLIAEKIKIGEKFAKAKSEKSQKTGFVETLLKSGLIGALTGAIIIGLFIISTGLDIIISSLLYLLINIATIFGFVFVVVTITAIPFVWLYLNKNKTTKFTIAFTGTFIAMNLILWLLFTISL
ncbi:MAG: sulfite exporter TauE/SafE family protein [archaeon]|nr:sulfite exporter TauE/SafE family protein [archaeon]